MTNEEWESLCDHCGKCCLIKLEDQTNRKIHYTSVVCDLIDLKTCRCTHYRERTQRVPDCLELIQQNFSELNWLPATCAYRLLSNGEELPDWHPLITGTQKSVENSGISIKSYAIKESQVDNPQDHIIQWLDR